MKKYRSGIHYGEDRKSATKERMEIIYSGDWYHVPRA